ncbi:MAG: S8 family peptidase [Kiloniellales bacterium]|nr:S8 family peptidase [Kiloniellales bacterium]
MAQIKHLDPRLRRICRTMSIPARLENDVVRGVVAGSVDNLQPEATTKSVLVTLSADEPPPSFGDHRWTKIIDRIYSAEIPLHRLEELASEESVEMVEAGRELSPSLDTSLPETRADLVRTAEGLDGAGVVVGIIDFGLDYTLDDFRNPDGSTRVDFLWDQFLTPLGAESSPANFNTGVEYRAADIDAALQAMDQGQDPFSIVRHDPGVGSHGTHVASTAAGNGRSADAAFPPEQYRGAAPGARIVFVQPNSQDADTSFTDSVRVAEAVAYIFEKADELGLPCVINMSLGQNGGSHDGESIVERAIDRFLEQPGRSFVVAAGNEHIWRGHASGNLSTGGSRVLHWKVGGRLPLPGGGVLRRGFGDFTPNEMEIWYSSRDRFRVRVRDPQGNESDWVEQGQTLLDHSSGDRVFIDSERFTVLSGDARIYVEVSPPFRGTTIDTGVWEVEIEALEAQDGRFDAWIERDVRRSINNYADQSFFLGTDFDQIMTLGTPATNRRGVSVANYDHAVLAPNDSSGRGRTRDSRAKPEVAAPGTNILAANSMGGRPDGQGGVHPMRIGMSGTSMASPHVAGIVALLLQKDPKLTAEQIRSILIASASPPVGVTPFDVAWGFGRVDALTAVNLLD